MKSILLILWTETFAFHTQILPIQCVYIIYIYIFIYLYLYIYII